MTDLLIIVLLGIVEGLTEFLPVSSTGHLILAGRLLGLPAADATFDIVIQLGAILAVIVLYWRRFWAVAVGLFARQPRAWAFVRNIALGFLPAAAIGVVVYKAVKALLESPTVVAIALIVGGIAILVIERLVKPGTVRGIAAVPAKTSLGVGIIQCLAMIPGVSRSGATILGALSLGVERRTAAEFSFFLAIPTMLGASVVETAGHMDAIRSGGSVGPIEIAVGFVVSFVVALLVVRWFVGIVGRHGFGPFAWYRIAAGAIALIALSMH